jgi:hypothetical protein
MENNIIDTENIVYSICYYYERNKKGNIIEHMSRFDNIKNFNKQFILVVMTDNVDFASDIKNELNDFLHTLTNNKFKIIVNYNWGGTILGLWLAYKYITTLNIKSYIAFFEEDFLATDDRWLYDSIDLLLEKKYIYIGESNTGCVKSGNDDSRITNKKFANSIRLCKNEVWTDGGYYFSTVDKLRLVEETIGIFHKGDPTQKYDRLMDGIDYGEVGFPSLLNKSGFIFDALNRNEYFVHGF